MGSHSGSKLTRVRVIAQPLRHGNRAPRYRHGEMVMDYDDLDVLSYEIRQVPEYIGAHRRQDARAS